MDGGYTERFPKGNCQQNARWMAMLHPELAIVDGYIVFEFGDGRPWRIEHTWNETPDGQVVDSTAWAFADNPPDRYEPDPEAWPRFRAKVAEIRGRHDR